MIIVGIDFGKKGDISVETFAKIEKDGTIQIQAVHYWNQEIELTRTEYHRVDRSPIEGPLTDPHR